MFLSTGAGGSILFLMPSRPAIIIAENARYGLPDESGQRNSRRLAFALSPVSGIRNKIEPPTPVDKDLYELPPEEAAEIAQVPASLDAAINNLEADHDYLLEGGVFTSDLIEKWVELKREEIDAIRLRPHPYEFDMYYDI